MRTPETESYKKFLSVGRFRLLFLSRDKRKKKKKKNGFVETIQKEECTVKEVVAYYHVVSVGEREKDGVHASLVHKGFSGAGRESFTRIRITDSFHVADPCAPEFPVATGRDARNQTRKGLARREARSGARRCYSAALATSHGGPHSIARSCFVLTAPVVPLSPGPLEGPRVRAGPTNPLRHLHSLRARDRVGPSPSDYLLPTVCFLFPWPRMTRPFCARRY